MFSFFQTSKSRFTLSQTTKGMLLGLLAVMTFSLTLPATKMVIPYFHPVFISTGRAVVAAFLAMVYLITQFVTAKTTLPTLAQFKQLAVVGLGVVVCFPLCIALAMQYTNASHGGVILAILPLATTCCAFLFSKERPSMGFWITAVIGSALVMTFSLLKSKGGISFADFILLGAVLSAATSYAVGANVSKQLGGLAVISWALVISLPLILIPACFYAPNNLAAATAIPLKAWLGFLYMAVFSQFLGFLPWYKGLAMGGVAKVGQVQLLQTFFTIAASAYLLHEQIDLATIVFSIAIVSIVGIGKQLNVKKSPAPAASND